MTETKPHFRIIAGRPVTIAKPESKVDLARRRHGKPFAFESGSSWKPREVPLLTEWLSQRTREKT